MPLFNQAFVFEAPVLDDLAKATSWFSGRDVPFWVVVPDPDLPTDRVGDAEILTATDPAQLGDFAVVASEAFGAPLEAASTLSPASTLDDERCSWFLGYLDDEPAACGQLFRTADVAGVYSIGVRERFRRRGLGAAITAAVLAAGRDSGCSIGVLQASPMGAPVYDRMGFETVTQYHRFAPAG